MGQYTIKDVQNRAELLKDDIDNIYRALNDKLGSSPETLDKVPEYILSIPDLPTEEPLTITPTIDGQEISALDDLKYNPITVEPVTSAIDSNIQPENIKEGVTILGVAGTLSAGSDVFVVPDGVKFSQSTFTEVPSNWDFSNVTDMYYMFSNCTKITTIPQMNTSKVTSMRSMFYNCTKLTSIPNLDTSNVTDMGGMFHFCSNLVNIPQMDTSKVTNMGSMYRGCPKLAVIPQMNTSNVTDMQQMFTDCTKITTIPQMNTSKVTSMRSMFNNCTGLKTVPQMDTSNVTEMDYMFYNCATLNTVEGIDFSGLTSSLYNLFGYSDKPLIKRFIVNGKINVSLPNDSGIQALIAIDYDSVKSILAAADRTDNTNAKTLAFNRTMTDQNGELAALVSSCTSKGWTISGLTLQ